MNEIVSQLPTLIGVILGALASHLATSATERARWRRSISIQWDERRISAYEQYAVHIKKMVMICVRVAKHRGMQAGVGLVDSLAPDQGRSELDLAEEGRTVAWEAVLLLGSPEVIRSARRWHNSLSQLRQATFEGDDATWQAAAAKISDARQGFYAAARKDLHIPVEDVEVYRWGAVRQAPTEQTGRRP